jgi:uncharacterized protein YyaL (SSP411 family)
MPEVLGAEEGAFFADAYDITDAGNWEGVSIPNRTGKTSLSDPDEARLATARAKLLERRATRVRPGTDDKILADWNGLMIAAMAFAGASFARPDWIAMAERAFGFIAGTMGEGGRLAHSWRDGKSVRPGLASDYAAMAKAALALHSATLDQAWIARAEIYAAACRSHHWDASAPGYFLSADDAEALIVRPKATTDEATPSATSLMTQNLVRLWRLTGNDTYRTDADAILTGSGGAIAANLFATTGLLNALDLRLGAIDVAIVRPAGADTSPLLDAVRWRWSPNVVLSVHDDAVALPPSHPAAGKVAINGKRTAYVCRGEVCSLPVTTGEELVSLLDGAAG